MILLGKEYGPPLKPTKTVYKADTIPTAFLPSMVNNRRNLEPIETPG
jgi:hypothetical protein